MQGVAAAYDLAKKGDAKEIWLYDIDVNRLKAAFGRLHTLCGDVIRIWDYRKHFKGVDVVLNAATFKKSVEFNEIALRDKVSICDLGGNSGVVKDQLSFHQVAAEAGIVIAPDCGVAPGAANTLSAWMAQQDKVHSVEVLCGGLPQCVTMPLGYHFPFSIEGLINEYSGQAIDLVDGEVTFTDTLTDVSKH